MSKKQRSPVPLNRKLVSYLATAGATLGSASAGAAILHFDPDPDLSAVDRSLFAAGGLDQLTISYTWPGGSGGKEQGELFDDFSATASVDPTVADPLPNQLVLRTDDFAGTRVAHSSIAVGDNLRIAIGQRPPPDPDKGSDPDPDAIVVGNAIFAPGQMIDASADWGDDLSGKNPDPDSIALVPVDGFELYMGVRLGALEGVYYGWVHYTLHDTEVILHELALEQAPGTGIEVGAVPLQGTLPLLASGAAGLAAFRSRRKTAQKPVS